MPQYILFHSPEKNIVFQWTESELHTLVVARLDKHYGLTYLATLNICSLNSDYLKYYYSYQVNEISCIEALDKDLCIKFGYITKMAYC